MTEQTYNQIPRRPVLKAVGAGLLASPFISGSAVAEEQAASTAGVLPSNFAAYPWGMEVVADGELQPLADPLAVGKATFMYSDYDGRLMGKVRVANVQQVTGVHIYEGAVGENGSRLATLHPSKAGGWRATAGNGRFETVGMLARDDGDLADRVEGDITVLADVLKNHNGYVEIETQDGALRGQIRYDAFDDFRC